MALKVMEGDIAEKYVLYTFYMNCIYKYKGFYSYLNETNDSKECKSSHS